MNSKYSYGDGRNFRNGDGWGYDNPRGQTFDLWICKTYGDGNNYGNRDGDGLGYGDHLGYRWGEDINEGQYRDFRQWEIVGKKDFQKG